MNDEAVQAILKEIDAASAGPRVLRMLGATVLFAREQLSHPRSESAKQTHPLTLLSMERAMVREHTIDADLLHDVFAVVRAMDTIDSRNVDPLAGRAFTTWGPFALVTATYVVLRLAISIADHLPHATPDEVMKQWALAEELTLSVARKWA